MSKVMIPNSKISSQTTQLATKASKLNIQKALSTLKTANKFHFNQIVAHQKCQIIRSDILKCKSLNLMTSFIKQSLQLLDDRLETIYEDKHHLLIRSNKMTR